MDNFAPAFEAFLALEAVGDLTADPRPAWVFSRDGQSILWANPAGGAMFGARRFVDLAGKTVPQSDPFATQLANLARALSEGGGLARLRLKPGLRAVPLLCQCRPLRTADGQRGILVIALDAPAQDAKVSDAAAAVFADDAQSAAASRDADIEEGADAPRSNDDSVPATETQSSPADREPPMPVSSAVQDLDAPKPVPLPSFDSDPERFSQALLDESEPQSENGHVEGEAPSVRPDGAGRQAAARPFPRKPVRFLWQTDAADRFLFVSPGLGQLVGRTAEVVGETWHDVASRLKLDPDGRIAVALARHDTWSGLTAWWPVEDSDYRVPAELTALPVFGIDQSFQGFRGFGVLKPGDVVTPEDFRDRHGAADFKPLPEALPDNDWPQASETDLSGPDTLRQDGEAAAEPRAAADSDAAADNIVPLRSANDDLAEFTTLSPREESAFDEIAASLADNENTGWHEDSDSEPAGGAPDIALEHSAPVAAEPPPGEAAGAGEADSGLLASQLAEAQARIRELTSVLDTATDGVLVIDEDGIIERVNASGEALFGVGQADLVGRPLADLFDVESRQESIDYLSGLKENGVASVLNEGRDVKARAGDGTIPLFMTMGRIGSDEKGRFCAVLKDLTHWKQAEAELIAARQNAEAASSQKSDFLARVSHEIRTPLNAIIGFSEVMIEERFGPIENERYREYLRDMRTSGEHVVSLVNDLLDISKIEAGTLDLEFDAVPLNALVRECITLMQPQANRAHVILRSSLSPDVPSVVADQRTLRQIVLNLLSNSVKFTGPGGQVIAATAVQNNGEVILKVRDTGEGMSDEELARALEPFRQLTTAALGDGDGTGLGLPLTKALVEANRADFDIRSARSEGTIVTVAFPSTRVLSE